MTEDHIGYAQLIDSAMRGVVRDTLAIIKRDGLPGDHHCYLSFSTHFPGVEMTDYLRERYPDEMTIVLQHQFWDLDVTDDFFTVALSFNRKKEKLVIPFDALTAFADPSIKFGLQFQTRDAHEDEDEGQPSLLEETPEKTTDTTSAPASPIKGEENVITLDAFRNRKPTNE